MASKPEHVLLLEEESCCRQKSFDEWQVGLMRTGRTGTQGQRRMGDNPTLTGYLAERPENALDFRIMQSRCLSLG